jgi:hypothetical protein
MGLLHEIGAYIDIITPLRVAISSRMAMHEKTYGRGQVEWALWCSFTGKRTPTKDVPQIFRTRIKRLLDIDRELDLSDAEVPPEADYAFAPPRSAESGESAYTAIDAFGLAIALDFLDAGFKQAEVVYLMRYLRPELERRFPGLLKLPSITSRQRHGMQAGLPSYKENGRSYADARLFIIIQKLELTEIMPVTSSRRHAVPVILEPVFCKGVTALSKKLNDIMPNQRRTLTLQEVTANAQSVQEFLEAAPDIRRGRPSLKKKK